MKIEQFEDKDLSHYSYAILSECEREIILIDPSRNVAPYLDYAEKNEAKIVGVIETHPHADFVSGHLELHENMGASIYCSKLVAANYPHLTFDDGDFLIVGKIKLKAISTPGHSPDSISIVLEHNGVDKAVFTGDTLFIGDCGRPDLRESAGSINMERVELARLMYNSLREKLMQLADDVMVYPAHGAGSLCGKALSEANYSTIGAEKISNWSLQRMPENEFIHLLMEDQPFVPKYFPYDVELNKNGAPSFSLSIEEVNISHDKVDPLVLEPKVVVIDTRPADQFKKGHLSGSINLMANGKFETWLGSLISPGEYFYLAADNHVLLKKLIERTAKIGYEPFIKEAFLIENGSIKMEEIDLDQFSNSRTAYTIIDVRSSAEAQEQPIFDHAVNIPLPELRERLDEIPVGKPIVVHCAGGYRSAAASSIIAENTLDKVFDLGDQIKNFIEEKQNQL
ncbi:Metallo-beta-lactamase family protein [Arcticibacter svalbardensis MN12-7]|uniref:Metallo-beta-lactamase family protein n=1 Tax=Arcticibacter svalbardensis MN12-7 TaxID=1150600 RepID=R9GNW0_9SPHI|nr:MBL fold metallo-hydrolase [Arcticibacter svalbardensis]EOR93401.1 Metallo-beta-lactamase family protein [Arcticibacter svalbardensis MN12-7]